MTQKKNSFLDKTPTLDTYWRSIILLGKNVASYKFALAKTLLDIKKNSSEASTFNVLSINIPYDGLNI